jgi:pimeloyl-ACP methyl ester carboxylesterase
METSTVTVLDGSYQVELRQAGTGREVLWLHGEAGPSWNGFHDALARRWHVLAPSHPGYGASTGGDRLDDIHDAISTCAISTCSTRLMCATWRWWGMGWVGCLRLSLPPSSRRASRTLC